MTTGQRIRANDDGAALVLALLFMLALSSLGAGVMVLSRTETLSSMNYRMMSQARYGAESAIHKAAHFLLNSYTLPGSASDPLVNYDTTVSPVTYLGQPVVLTAVTGATANYPVAATQTAFAAAGQGTLPTGQVTVAYTSSATLLSMREVVPYGANAATVVQTWRLTGLGRLTGARSALVEVDAILERQVVPAHTYAAFATDAGCGALDFEGGVTTDSYDSSTMTIVDGAPLTDAMTGHVGTNGNLTESGGALINGSLSTPRTGVGNCTNGSVTALTQQGNTDVTEGISLLPQAVQYYPPDPPTPLPPTTDLNIGNTSLCSNIGLTSGSCSGTAGNLTIDPGGTTIALGDVHITGGAAITLHAGTYNINSLKLTGGATLAIGTGPAILNMAGTGTDTPIDFEGGATANPSFDPSLFRIHYAGTGDLKLTGGTTTSAIVYAPNAEARVAGGADFYGSVLARTVEVNGGAQLHYDRRLSRDFFTLGPQMMSGFTWKKQ